MLTRGETYDSVCASFRWNIPESFNMGVAACDRHAHQRYRLALIYEKENGQVEKYTFWSLRRLSNQFANALRRSGFERGDRLAILLPQCPETGIAHLAAYKTGGIALPLFTLFGPDALQYRLENSAARCVVTDGDNLEKVLQIKKSLPHLQSIFVTRSPQPSEAVDFWDALGRESTNYEPAQTRNEDPALLAYTSGTTGPPKGALHAHRTLIGHMPGVEFPHNFFPQEDDLFWTPADWAWLGGLLDVLLPSWFHGIPVLACRQKKFDPEFAFHLMAKHGVRNTFLPPTALKLMRQVPRPAERYDIHLRSVGSGGETLGEELLQWGRENLGLTINEFYGQTEVNLVVGNCFEVMPIKPGSMGKAIPGHTVEIIDEKGQTLPAGATGSIAIRCPDPVMMLQYWKNPEATSQKFAGDWWLTGDIGRKDEDGYLWFIGRDDDLITSSGYRIGPGEIEDCLIKHPAVGMAAVIGVPDEVRTEIIKAFIVLSPGVDPDPVLEADIRNFIKERLAAHEYPREIEFVGELPLTATGKIIRKELRQREIEKQHQRQP